MAIQYNVVYGNSFSSEAFSAVTYYRNVTGRTPSTPFAFIMFKNSIFIDGVVLYNNYFTDGNIDIHLEINAKSGIYNRKRISQVLSYPFNQLKCTRITGNLRSDNTTLINIAERLGFKLEAQLKNYFGEGIDNMVYSATRQDLAKWIK